MAIKGELFSTDMVKAFLEGRKSRTSRPMKCHGTLYQGETLEEWTKRWNVKPKYKPGDIMYVRETWCEFPKGVYHFKADYDTNRDTEFYQAVPDAKWHPSLHMPREAARLFFRVTDVKAQRLEDITEQDAIEDGFEADEDFNDFAADQIRGCARAGIDAKCNLSTALSSFKDFWEKQYGTESSWMWVCYLEPVKREEALHGDCAYKKP